MRRRFEVPVLVVALLVVPVIIIEDRAISQAWQQLAAVFNWLVWLVFIAEFVAVLWVTRTRWAAVRAAWLDLIIIVTSFAVLPAALGATRLARLLRLGRALRGLRPMRLLAVLVRARHAARRVGPRAVRPDRRQTKWAMTPKAVARSRAYSSWVTRLFSLSGRSPSNWTGRGIDVVIAVFSTGAAVALHLEVVSARGEVGLVTVALAVATIHGSAVLLRKKSPLWVLAVLMATAWLYVWLGFPAYMLGPATVFAMYSAAVQLPRRMSLAAAAIVVANMIALLGAGPGFPGLGSIVLYGGIIVFSWGLGDLVARWRRAAEEHARRADELAATREELAGYAVSEERRRIARELHDVVAHAMTVVAMHAGTGRVAAATDPAAARSSLQTIETVSREALSEMRRLVTLLRDESEDRDDLSPSPGLGDLHRLVGEMVAAGMVVDVQTEGPIREVPPGLSLVAYRTIQEALTNAARHAGQVRTRLKVMAVGDDLVLVVENDPPASFGAPSNTRGGTGLVGMRERINLYDGSLITEHLPDGGYRVEAHFPLGPLAG
jgi:signal transduction histidine kinase